MAMTEARVRAFVQLLDYAKGELEVSRAANDWDWEQHWCALCSAYSALANGVKRQEAAFWMVPPGLKDEPGNGTLVGASQAVLHGYPVEDVARKCYFRVK